MTRALVLLTGMALGLTGCRPPPPPLTNEVYVWQRAWTPEIPAAVQASRSAIHGYCFLWREITFVPGGVRATPAAPDLDALTGVLDHAAFAIRIPEAPGGLNASEATIRVITAEIQAIRRRSKAAGLGLDGIQIDYDCPTRSLRGYADFLTGLKRALPGERLTPTVLPTWLVDPAWPALAHAADGFVLQLHDIGPPEPDETSHRLCDPAAARQAIAIARRQGVAFRVALPTYSSEVFYDASHRIVAVASEGEAPPPDAPRRVQFTSPPAELAALVRALAADHPPELTGLIWYRLPLSTDRRNWPMATFLAVIEGRSPKSRIAWRREPLENGAETIVAENVGDAAGPMPVQLAIPLNSRNLIASDALPPYDAKVDADTLVFQRPPGPGVLLAPGSRRRVGWLRTDPSPR